MTTTDLAERLHAHKQSHLLVGLDALSAAEQEAFRAQLAALDYEQLNQLYAARDAAPSQADTHLAPLPVEEAATLGAAAHHAGEAALKAGQVAALVVAGGQGSRLGSDIPKGLFPVGPVSDATLFQFHAEQVVALSRKSGRPLPFLVMTSPATHAATAAFFAEQNFGLAPGQLRLFQQGTMPAADLATGRLLLEAPGRLFLSPNGHGGTLTALADSGLLGELHAAGVQHIFYFQVDNPLVKIADPAFLGRHILTQSEASTKVVRKTEPGEKVGVLAEVNGRCAIVEYSDLPADLAAQRDAAGHLVYSAGNTGIHLFTVPFLERITTGANRLRFHAAKKKVPHWNPDTRQLVTPERENAVKYELFVFDALPLADRYLIVRVERAEEFAPLKNASGPDSPATVRQAISNRSTAWLTAAGVAVPAGVPVELSPLAALDETVLKNSELVKSLRLTGPTRVE